MPALTHVRTSRRTSTRLSIALCTIGAVLLWSPGALAAAGCTTTTPSIGQTIVCSTAGTETITIPTGANYATVVVIGGGGASGSAESNGRPSGAGGNGAQVSADVDVSSGTSLSITVGAGGVAPSGITRSGSGGQFSRVAANGAELVVAGGGGGGAAEFALSGGSPGSGGSGAAAGTAAGGSGGSGPGTGFLTGGGGGNQTGAGEGGTRGSGTSAGPRDGQSWANGGNGGRAGNYGGGGSGYGGGGSGGSSDSSISGYASGGAGGSFAHATLASSVIFAPVSASPGDSTPGAGAAAVITRTSGNAGQAGSITITFFFRAIPPTSSQPIAPRMMSVDFTLGDGVQCDFTSVEASLGSWIQLPAASECTITPRAGGESPTLLGWATKEHFPVAIAQRQVDNGWDAYETFNDEGQLTGVFIPAGGYTTVSNDTNLYPIWSN